MDQRSIVPLEFPLPTKTKKAADPKFAPRATILLVEDDNPLRLCLSEMLQVQGYAVLPARDGHEAIHICQTGTAFDLLFTDLKLPGGLNGCELASEIGKRRPGLPVLLTSGYMDCGGVKVPPCAAFLMKPYKVSDLQSALSVLLARQKIQARSVRQFTCDSSHKCSKCDRLAYSEHQIRRVQR